MNVCKIYAVVLSFLFALTADLHCKASSSDGASPVLSLMTCSPGDELYAAYGHSAVRLKDDSLGIDWVFNYGTFNFDTPNFYGKFLQGTLDYCLSVSPTNSFLRIYDYEGRAVVEREIILPPDERRELASLLVENSREENRYYRYDFLFDNCATRIRDIVLKAGKLQPLSGKANFSYRDCLHAYVPSSRWTGQGIDLILGMETDYDVALDDVAMLPDSLEAYMVGRNLVSEPRLLLQRASAEDSSILSSLFSPSCVAVLLILLFSAFSVFEYHRGTYFKWLDVCLFSVLAVLSLLFSYLWFISEIRTTSWNWNLLWANPLAILILISLFSRPLRRLKPIILLTQGLILLWFVLVVFGVQFAPVLAFSLSICSLLRCSLLLHR